MQINCNTNKYFFPGVTGRSEFICLPNYVTVTPLPLTHPDSVDGDPKKSSASPLRGAAGRHGDSERELTPRLATIGYVGRLTNTQTQLDALAHQISENMQKHCKRNFSESTLCYSKTTQIQPSSSGPEDRIKSALLLAAAQQIKPSAVFNAQRIFGFCEIFHS